MICNGPFFTLKSFAAMERFQLAPALESGVGIASLLSQHDMMQCQVLVSPPAQIETLKNHGSHTKQCCQNKQIR